ncbi:MAG: glutaredoxin family protein [Gammaproteobacteria bacterium]
MTDARPILTLYSREHCHLCGVMVAELQPVLARYPVRFQILDVDADPQARALYGNQIPVLLLDGVILSRFRLDAARVESALGQLLA